MIKPDQTTLAQYLIERTRSLDMADADQLVTLLIDVSRACKTISRSVAQGALGGMVGKADSVNVQGEVQARLDLLSDEIFRRRTEFNGTVAAVASEELEDIERVPDQYPAGPFLLLHDPLDGSSNIDVNVSVGSIFSVLRVPRPGEQVETIDFMQPGTAQVAAGYAIYGPSTMLVLTLGDGVDGFTLDPFLGDFVLTHPAIRIPKAATEFAINASNARWWEPPVRRYIEECVAGTEGPRGKDFNTRWVASLVADAHRILMRGGIYLYPRDRKEPRRPGRLRLLYEVNPIGFVVEQAGGKASTGTGRVLDIMPATLHQRAPLIFGSADEVERIEAYFAEPEEPDAVPLETSPLFAGRGLFRELH
ncbi:class 1 fructose-bisphosphatase [Rhodospirillum sp. A1_3_36]|uniref:class 1 fructose-bisphosphatase n=1 Tax=Rhodospirillum sp. A1_3_36 TaxID=3391666 RepID=UPI0039A60865